MIGDLVPMPAASVANYEMIILPPSDAVRHQLQEVRRFQALVQELFVEGHDFGKIPGTGDKPTLLKPGAEKLIKLLSLADTYEFAERVEDWERPFFSYTVRCQLRSMTTGMVVAEGLGNCNSYESKYRYRWAWPNELSDEEKVGLKTRTLKNGSKQYRIENEDIYSLVNTLIKMGCKRAQMAAALSAGRLSEVFTQDLDELADNGVIGRRQPDEAASAPANGRPASNGQAARPAQQPPINVERIANEADPRWGHYVTLCGTASQLGIKLPGGIELPVAAPALQAATAGLTKSILAKGGTVPAGGPPQAAEEPIPEEPPEPEQEAIAF